MFGSVVDQRVTVVVLNALEYGTSGFDRVALRLGAAAAEEDHERKAPKY
jgi:hypothetical protein